MLIIGHRGARGLAPENTLSSFQKAIDCAVDAVELDVYAIEGRLLVIHGGRLEYTTAGQGRILDHTVAELREIDAGNGQKIPFLEEVLDLIDKKLDVNVELKGPGSAGVACKIISKYVKEKGWSWNNFLISSFDHHMLAEAKHLLPKVPRGALYANVPLHFGQGTELIEPIAINLGLDFVRQEFVDDAHRRSCNVYVYTVNHVDDARDLQAMGVDGIFTDYPDRMKKLFDAQSEK